MRNATFAALAWVLCGLASGLDNGLGATPAMGYSSWNDCSSFRDNGKDGWCWEAEAHIRNVTRYFISSGLAQLGYTQMNVDEGWLLGRNPNGTMKEDLEKFPSGMKGLGDWIKSQRVAVGSAEPAPAMRYGLYSCRGTCQCGTRTYSAPGSHGFEKQDVDWMVAAGAQYLKIDSCCGNQDHATAFSDYAKFRDAINATGDEVWFSLCGWEEWYSPPDPALHYKGGASLGNSWRIAGDGSGWGPLTNCMNKQAAAAPYIGPGGWADPDLLIGPKVSLGGQTDQQARAQFTLWSLFPTNLLISQNVLEWSPFALETYSNEELIAINQDPAGHAARRIAGGDLTYPCKPSGCGDGCVASVIAAPCDPHSKAQAWSFDSASGVISPVTFDGVLDIGGGCNSADGEPVRVMPSDAGSPTPCSGKRQEWAWQSVGAPFATLTNLYTGKCLDVPDWGGPVVDTVNCGAKNRAGVRNFTISADGHIMTEPRRTSTGNHPSVCLEAVKVPPQVECTGVWGRALSGSDFALGFVNNGDAAVNVTCDASCFATLLQGAAPAALKVRDLWAHADLATLKPPYSFTSAVAADGFATAYRLSPP